MNATALVAAGDVTERGRKHRIIRRKIGPPRRIEEPKVPEDLSMLVRRRDSLIDRLEKVRNNNSLQLSQFSRDTIDEAIAIIHRNGWDQ